MKRFFFLFSLLICLTFSVNALFAGNQNVLWTISGVNTSASGGKDVNTTLKTSSIDPTSEKGVWTAVASSSYASSNSGAQFGSGSYTFAGTISLSGTSIPSTATIKTITINCTSSGSAYKVDATVDGQAFGSQVTLSDNGSKVSTAKDFSFTGSQLLGENGSIVLTFSSGGKKNVVIKSILVTYTPAGGATLQSIAVSGAPTKTSYYAGQNFNPAGLTVTGTYSDASIAPITSDITWAYNPSQTLTLNQTSIKVTATVDEIESAEYNVTGLTVSAPVNYEKVTATPSDWSGEYLLVYESGSNAYVYTGVDANNNCVTATISNDVIAIPDGAAKLTIASMDGGYSIRLSGGTNDGKYISGTSGTNTTKFTADPVANTLSIDNGSAVITAGNTIRFNSGSATLRFRYYGATAQQPVQLYKKVDGTVKPSAELSYAAADQKKLTKLGESFTAPTLVNPHGVAVTYASSAESVAEVAANGAVTIKAAGVAVITASFAGNDDYKEGSASYTIGVTTKAGTQADPYVAADAKIAIDVVGTVENAYATGIVSNVVTTTLPQEGYITFYFSADGATTGQQIEAYKCFGLNSAKFTAVTDIETGSTVVITGTLKKYNSTYEFDQNCHLVSYEAPAVPKTSIANTKETAYTVAQALVYAADGVTYDLDDYVYVQGVVYDVKSFNSTNGTLDIYIKDANAENQFELYKCVGINDGTSTTAFTGLNDVQVGNVVIGYGQLTVYNTTYEFKQGNYLVDLQTPATGVELDKTEASVEEEATVTLTATILPSNATGTIVWSVESGSDKASVENGVVTGIAEGEATIRATIQGTEIYAECTVTVTAKSAPTPVLTDYYEKVTETAGITDGTYLIVYEDGNVAFNGGLETLDAASNTIAVAITNDNKIGVTEATAAATFFIDVTAGSIQAANGKYIGANSYSNRLDQSEEASAYVNALSIDDDDNAVITISNSSWDGDLTLRYNSANNQARFRYYKNGQQPIQLYKLANETVKANPELEWSGDVEITLGETFTAPTLDNPHSVEGITYASDNETLATVTDAGVIELVADATGTAHITASFAGNDDYKAVNVSCTITVNAATPTPTTDNVVILAVYDEKYYAMSTTVSNSAFTAIAVEYDGTQVTVKSEAEKTAIQWTKATSENGTTFQDANNKYMKGTDNGAAMSLNTDPCYWSWDETNEYYYIATRSFFYYKDNIFKNYATSNMGKTNNGYSGKAQVIAIAAENIVINSKVSAELAYNPASAEITEGDAWTAPELVNPHSVTISSYSTDNEAVATVSNAGVIALAGGTGTAVITAHFEGDATYLEGDATYTITVNSASPSAGATYHKVTATEDITDGEYLIVYETENVAFNGNLTTLDAAKNTVSVGISNNVIEGSPDIDAAVFTIDVAKGTLRAHMGDYIGVTSYGNGLKQNANPETYPVHSFSIDGDGNAVISLNNNWTAAMALNYNKGTSDKRFRYYKSASPQQPIQLYKKDAQPVTKYTVTYAAGGGSGDAPAPVEYEEGETFTVAEADLFTAPEGKEFDTWNDGTNDYAPGATYTVCTADVVLTAKWKDAPQPEELRPNLEQGRLYSACMTRNIIGVQGGILWDISHYEGTKVYFEEIVVSPSAPLTAGRPFILMVTGDFKVSYSGDEISVLPAPSGNSALRGTFSDMDQAAFNTVSWENNDSPIYMLYNNQLRQVADYTHTNLCTGNSLAANRAYLLYSALIPGQPNLAPGRRVMTMSVEENVATDINFSNGETINASKIIRNGQILILRDGKTFDVTGRELK